MSTFGISFYSLWYWIVYVNLLFVAVLSVLALLSQYSELDYAMKKTKLK